MHRARRRGVDLYGSDAEHKPEFPDLEWTRVPDSSLRHARTFRNAIGCRALEGGFDSSHLSFLHGGSPTARCGVVPTRYEVVPTDFGFVVGTGRDMGDEGTFWTANVMLMPFHKIIASSFVGRACVGADR